MANRVFIIPRRNDLNGMNVQITDLWPNTSQKNNVLDGEGQTHYIDACPDTAGATYVNGAVYVSGPKTTLLAANPVISDTTGGGNDCYAPAATSLGLASYLRERVAKDPGGANTFLTFANANTIAAAIRTAAEAGAALDLAAINVLLAATGGAGTELTNAGGSRSFGTVLDIMRILSGETYLSPQYTIITDAVPNFLDEAARDVLVAAQVPIVTGKTFVSKGHFLASTEPGFVNRPILARTGYVLASIGAGQLSHVGTAAAFLNNDFTYGAAGTALDIAGNHIAATGSHAIAHVYTDTGVCLI